MSLQSFVPTQISKANFTASVRERCMATYEYNVANFCKILKGTSCTKKYRTFEIQRHFESEEFEVVCQGIFVVQN
jgi:hypothetical protein